MAVEAASWAAGRTAPPPSFPPASSLRPQRRTLADFIASAERAKAAQEERERVRKAEEREYRRERYAREKAIKRGDPNPPPPPVSPAGRRREAERVAREQERQRWIALASR